LSLLEVLVTLALLGLGLTGLLRMQALALQSAHSGWQRSVAALQLQDAAERLWAARCRLSAQGQGYFALLEAQWQAVHQAPAAGLALPEWSGSMQAQAAAAPAGPVYTLTVRWHDRSDPTEPWQTLQQSLQLPHSLC
jgi:type IV pilus assembly protein PilV